MWFVLPCAHFRADFHSFNGDDEEVLGVPVQKPINKEIKELAQTRESGQQLPKLRDAEKEGRKEGKKERKNKRERKQTKRKERKRKGKERKGKERKGKERKGKERKGKESRALLYMLLAPCSFLLPALLFMLLRLYSLPHLYKFILMHCLYIYNEIKEKRSTSVFWCVICIK